MSPLKKQKLSKIRKELDNLDNVLIKIIKKRTNLVNYNVLDYIFYDNSWWFNKIN